MQHLYDDQKIVFEKLEDEYDLKVSEEFDKDKTDGTIKTYSNDETWKKLGL